MCIENNNLQTSDNTLIEQFINAIVARKTFENNPKKANKLFDEIHMIFKELRDTKQLEKLRPLLDYDDIDIRSSASAYYLLVDEDLAKKKLREIAKLGGIYSLTEELINQWDNGEVTFDY
jgi:hypothetical protein